MSRRSPIWARSLPRGRGFIERVITVAGNAVARPGNYLVPIGTPLRFLLELCRRAGRGRGGGFRRPDDGPGGRLASTPRSPRGSRAYWCSAPATSRRPPPEKSIPCIKCGKCIESLPDGISIRPRSACSPPSASTTPWPTLPARRLLRMRHLHLCLPGQHPAGAAVPRRQAGPARQRRARRRP